MKEPTDLYALLRFYANKTRSPSFPIEIFISFLDKYSKRYAAERPDLAAWAENTAEKVYSSLSAIVDSGRCAWVDEPGGKRLVVSQFYIDLIRQAYHRMDEEPDRPFPNEDSLRTALPPDQTRTVIVESDFPKLMEEESGEDDKIIKLVFPGDLGSIIALSGMVPRKLTDLALRKIGNYLRAHNNKEYVTHKLAPAFQGKEAILKDRLAILVSHPSDAQGDLVKSGDFTYSFWAYFANVVKNDLGKKTDKLAEDLALYQAIILIEFINNHYKGLEQKARSAETALRALDLALDKAPYLFTHEDITRLSDSKGVPLLGQYTPDELDGYLRDQIASAELEGVPQLLLVHGLNGERWYIRKTQILPLCARLLAEARPRVKADLSQRWFKLLKDFDKELSMADNEAFEKELAELTVTHAPKLAALLKEKALYLVHQEMENASELPENIRLFAHGGLAPYSELYLLSRKDLLTDVKMMLPFWYTIPLLARLAAFFKGSAGGRRKTRKKGPKANADTTHALAQETSGGEPVRTEASPELSHKVAGGQKANKHAELVQAAKNVEKHLVPKDQNIDQYMSSLRDHWNLLIDPKAKANLTEDINSLIRDYLRKTIRSMRAAAFTRERVRALAETLSEAPALKKLPAKEALKTYIQVYMVKLVIRS